MQVGTFHDSVAAKQNISDHPLSNLSDSIEYT